MKLRNRLIRFSFFSLFGLMLIPSPALATTATGGDITTMLDGYRIHTFTNGTADFTVTVGGDFDVLVVGGGGGGGETIGGGGGGGGVIVSNNLSLTAGVYSVTVGNGGAGGWGGGYPAGTKGANSVFATLTAIGGGAGGGYNEAASGTGGSSGGNGAAGGARAGYTAGQGNNGGVGDGANAGGGGGGANQVGAAGSTGIGGKGGDGIASSNSGASVTYAGGGGGGTRSGNGAAGAGGSGGGGAGGTGGNPGINGTGNTGGGGGGGGFSSDMPGGAGGSGIVIVRYFAKTFDVTALAATSVGVTTATLNGKLIVNGGEPNTEIAICWGPSDLGAGGATSDWPHVEDLGNTWVAGNSFSRSISGLTQGATNYYRCYAKNSTGEVWSVTAVRFITVSPPSVTNVGASYVRRLSATLNGLVTKTGAQPPSTWFYYWADGSQTTNVAPQGPQSGAFSANVVGLAASTLYHYSVLASNVAGTDLSEIADFNTLATTEYYVSLNGNGSDGSSWAKAYTNIQSALDVALNGDTVCTAGGQTFSLTQQLTMAKSGISVIGGYQGSGAPGSHDPTQWQTIVTRNPAFDDFRLIEARSNANTLIEGLTLTGGRFMNTGSYPGLYLNGATNVTVRNCVIRGNGYASWPYYTYYGGGVGVINSTNVLFSGCRIADNVCVVYGAGAYLLDSSAITFTNCVIQGNNSLNGDWNNAAGILAVRTPTSLIDCQIIANQTGGGGCGGVANYNCEISLKNCLVAHNIGSLGAGLSSMGGHMVLENCTISGNVGSGVMLHDQNGATLSLTNSIIWDNTVRGLAMYDGVDRNYDIFHSCLQPGFGTNAATAITGNPLFENNGAYGSYLASGSPCINAGAGTASDLGLSGLTVRVDGSVDTGTVDVGFHYAAGVNLATKNLYVSISSGNDSNAGTEGAPFKTITHALAVSTGGEVIHVAAGTYSSGVGESFPLTFTAKNGGIEIIGDDPATTIIVGGGRAFQVSLVNSFALRNVTIRDSYRYEPGGGGAAAYLMAVGSTTISNCWISGSGCGWDGYHQQPGAAIYHKYCSLNLMDCIFSNNAAGWSGAGGAVYTASGTMNATRCVFKNNSAVRGNGGAVYIDASSCSMSNVLFAANDATNYGDAIYVASGSLDLQSATIANNAGEGINNAGGTVTAHNSIIWGNTDEIVGTVGLAYCDIGASDSTSTNGCIGDDPLFYDTTYYHLQSLNGTYTNGFFSGGGFKKLPQYSSLLDAGDPASDWANEPLPNGRRIAIGAYGNTEVSDMSGVMLGTVFSVR